MDQILEVTEQYIPETIRGDVDDITLDDDCSTLFDDMSFDDSLTTLSYSLSLNDSLTISYDEANEDGSMTIPSIRSFIELDDETLTFDDSSMEKQASSAKAATADSRQDDTFEDEVVSGRSFGEAESGRRSAESGRRSAESWPRDKGRGPPRKSADSTEFKPMGRKPKHLRNRLSLACCVVGVKPPVIQEDFEEDAWKSHKTERSVSTTKSSSTWDIEMDSDRKKKEFMRKLREISSEHGGYMGGSTSRRSTGRQAKGKGLGEHPLPLIILHPVERDHSLLSTGFPDEDETDPSNDHLIGTANKFDHWADSLTITETKDSYDRPWDRRLDTASF